MKGQLTIERLGEVPYDEALAHQRALVERRARDEIGDTLVMLTHPHTFTIGRRGSEAEVLIDESERLRLGVQVHHVDRGGKVTYHGPGQWVAYPIVKLDHHGGDVLKYVRGLEEVMIRTASDVGVAAGRIEGLTGVWVDDRKLGAIGVRIHLGVTYHGLALNVDPDLSFFQRIIPCGIPDKGVTSLALEGASASMDSVRTLLEEHFYALFSDSSLQHSEGLSS